MKALKFSARCFAVMIAVALTVSAVTADDPKAEATTDNKLVGTWKSISAKYGGQEVKRPEGYTQVKHITPTQFMWAIYDADGRVGGALGGNYTVKGDEYVETPRPSAVFSRASMPLPPACAIRTTG